MIKISHVIAPSVRQMEFIIEGMRNPMNSWKKTDSYIGVDCETCDHVEEGGCCSECESFYGIEIGPNDKKLMKTLYSAGTEHRKFMRMMPIYARITAPLYWWKEFDTYKIGTVANSCSTMHKIAAKEFAADDFSTENLGVYAYEDVKDGDECHICYQYRWIEALKTVIDALNDARERYICEKDPDLKKQYWWQMIQLLPSSYNQTRNVMMNYEVLINMYAQRKNHKLNEWHTFCDWVKSVPYMDLFIEKEEKK